MKRLIFLLLLFGVMSCDNREIIFPDNSHTAVYFPIQYPVRTVSLGEDRVDNPFDRERKFHIGVSIGGMYKNYRDWKVDFVLDESLAENLITSQGDSIFVLPSHYYTMTPQATVTIPKGSFSGLIQIQLLDAFFEDTRAIGNHFVIPLRIASAEADSILTGVSELDQPDRRIAEHWDVIAPPRDFTLFMIKYVNPYHGSYLRRGVTHRLDNISGQVLDTTVYRQQYVEGDQVVRLTTQGINWVYTNFSGLLLGNDFSMKLQVNENGLVHIDSIAGKRSKAFGVGESKYVKNGGTWGGFTHDAMFLNYKYINQQGNHFLTYDTIVFRDRGLKYEEFQPVVLN